MSARNRYPKFLAFVPAVVLVGALIAFKAGAFHAPPPPEPDTTLPLSTAADQTTLPPAIFYGSKSAPVVLPEVAKPSDQP